MPIRNLRIIHILKMFTDQVMQITPMIKNMAYEIIEEEEEVQQEKRLAEL